jgi:hypothetical protein
MELEKAKFEPFVWRDHTGHVRFANADLRTDGRFRERVWPVLARNPRSVDRRRPSDAGPCWQKVNRSIIKSSNVSAVRRWLPCNPLYAHVMRVEDAWAYRRGRR